MPFTVSNEERQELAVTYAALILNDDKAPISAENIQKLVSAAGVQVEAYWPKIFAKLLEGRDVDELLLNAGAAGPAAGGAAPAAGGDAPAAAVVEEEPEEESEEEEDMGFSLFD